MSARLACSFCQKSETEVRKLVAGGGGGYICDVCVSIAARIIADSDTPAERRGMWARMRSGLLAVVSGRRARSNLRVFAA
jgi:ATP-dependent protease Clp ATPase subunit